MAPKKPRKKPSPSAAAAIRRVKAAARNLKKTNPRATYKEAARVLGAAAMGSPAHVASVRKLRRAAEAGARSTSSGSTRGQLALPHVPPPPPREHSPEELAAMTVQTVRVGRLRADRWQAAAAAERRPWAIWAQMQLDAACDAAGLPALPQGAR